MKKTLALVLALLMCAMLVPASAFAANEPLKTASAVNLGIKGDWVINVNGNCSVGTYYPEEDITDNSVVINANGKTIWQSEGLPCFLDSVNGVLVRVFDGGETLPTDMDIYSNEGKYLGNADEIIQKYIKNKYGSDAYFYTDFADWGSTEILVYGSYESSDGWGYIQLVVDPAALKVIFEGARIQPEEVGMAFANWYVYGGLRENMVAFNMLRANPATEEYDTIKSGYMNADGKVIMDLTSKYHDVHNFSGGLASVENWNGKFGYIDKTGKEVIPCVYDYGYLFHGDYARVEKNGKFGFVDRSGKEVIPCTYDFNRATYTDIFPVYKSGMYGVVDKNNSVIVPFEYDKLTDYDSGVMYGIKNGTVYAIKFADNAAVIEPEVPAATDVKEKFGDVPATAWYGPFLQKAFDNGIVGGMSADKFGPDSNLTNAQIMVMVANLHAMQKGEKIDLAALSDGSHWASAFRNYCKAEGIIDSRFDSKMDAKVNRGEMAYYFANAISAKSYTDKNEANFSDVNGNAYAAEITKLAKAGIVGGFSDGTFKADQLVTRAQSCVFVSNLIDAMGK